MIHFDFVMDDLDVENLMSLFGSAISDNYVRIIQEVAKEKPNQNMIDAYNQDIDYLNELRLNMKNTRVDASTTSKGVE